MVALITFPFVILLLLSWIHGFMGNVAKLAEVKPINPNVEDGGMLVLNCTLTPLYNGVYNASAIYFSHFNRKNYTYPHVQTLSNITAQLRLPNITSNMSGRYRCYLPGIHLGGDAVQVLHVVKKLLRPVLNSCFVSNWEQMECRWSPSRAGQDDRTHQTLFYRNQSDKNNWKTCPQNASEKCTWPATRFKMGATYCIQINVTNERLFRYVIASDVTCVSAQEEIVKPNPPEHVESSFASEFDGHVTLRWDPPTSSYQYEMPLIYQVHVQNQWHNQISNVTTETSLRLSVVPATSYTVQISVRPSRGGFASEKVVTRFETPATVPCKNPNTQTNAFCLAKEKGKVLLYWQPIAARDSCGHDLSYEVRARQSDGATNSAGIWRSVSSVASSDNSVEVMLSEEEDEVTIQSKNNIGIATHLPHVVIRVPPSSSKGSSSSNYRYRLVVEGNNNSVMAHWFDTAQPQVENVMGYTLFWCQQQSHTPICKVCKTPILWKNLTGAESEYNLILSDNYLHFQIGLAVNYLSGSTSGITWADKLYSQTAKAEAPRIVVNPYLGSPGEIDISWTTTPCIVHCAYVHTFIISYCLADHQNKCHGENHSVNVQSWKGSTYTLANLEQGSKYRIWMTSVARTESSEPSAPIYATTTKSWVTAGAVTGIIIAILFVGTIAVGGLYIILRCCNKYRKRFVTGLKIPVALPPTHRVQLQSTSSDAPMLGTKYDHQGSVSSGDSGRCSLSPASPATSPLLSKLTDANGNLDSYMPGNFSTMEDMKVEDDNNSTHGCVMSYTIVSNDSPKRGPAVPNGAAITPGNFSTREDMDAEDDDESTHGCVMSYTLVPNDATKGGSAVPNGAAIMPGYFSTLEDMKADDDDESTHGCVMAYTIVSNDAPKGEPAELNGATNMGDPTIPNAASNRKIAGHSKYISLEQIELLGMFPRNPPSTESEVNYCTGFSFSHPSAGDNNYAADIAYAKVETLQQRPLCDRVNRMPTEDAVNERSRDFNALQSDSSQDAESVEQSDLMCTVEQLQPTLDAYPPLTNDPQIDDPVTSSERSEPVLPRPGDNGATFRGYTKNADIDYPVEWMAGKPDFPQQSPLSNWGYVDHTMFGVDSIA